MTVKMITTDEPQVAFNATVEGVDYYVVRLTLNDEKTFILYCVRWFYDNPGIKTADIQRSYFNPSALFIAEGVGYEQLVKVRGLPKDKYIRSRSLIVFKTYPFRLCTFI